MTIPEFTIRATHTKDWPQVKQLRLAMLRDTPIAFAETYAQAIEVPESEWISRAERGMSDTGTALVAIAEDGTWLGTMGAYIPEGISVPLLVGVYVRPEFRGTSFGIADALLGAVTAWAQQRSPWFMLHVHEDNARALAYYERHGFMLTGDSTAYNLDPSKQELEMIKSIG